MDLNQVKEIIEDKKELQERNAIEVKNYYNALMFLTEEAENNNTITEELIFKIHNLVEGKTLSYKNKYRDGQNIVKDLSSGGNCIYASGSK